MGLNQTQFPFLRQQLASKTAALSDIIISPTTGLSTTEAGGTDEFTIVLATPPTADVRFAFISSNPAEGTISPAGLTFTTANFNIPQTVTITGIDDELDEGDIDYTIITVPLVSTDPNYNGINPPDISVTNINDDTPAGVTLVQSGGSTEVAEGGNTDTYTLALNAQPTGTVTISILPDLDSVTSPTSVTFTTANFNIPQTITVRAFDDNEVEGPHTSTITHTITSSDTEYASVTVPNVVAIVRDNDSPPPPTPTAPPIVVNPPLPPPPSPIQGTPGNDLLAGTAADDNINGLAGNDTLLGQMGADLVIGDVGNDLLYGNQGADVLDGGIGIDLVFGGKGTDSILGGENDDIVGGDIGNDTVDGGNGNDLVFGSQGNDIVLGGNDNDVLFGGIGDDTLNGGEGSDLISGDLGRDVLIGAGGIDTFVLRASAAVNDIAQADLIADFQINIDAIALTAGLEEDDLILDFDGRNTIIRIENNGQVLGVVSNVAPGLLQDRFIDANVNLV